MEAINLTLAKDVKEIIDHVLEDPEIIYPGLMYGYSDLHGDFVWEIVGYDQKWLDNNQERYVSNGNPLFYKIGNFVFIMQQIQPIKELRGKYMMKLGTKLVVL